MWRMGPRQAQEKPMQPHRVTPVLQKQVWTRRWLAPPGTPCTSLRIPRSSRPRVVVAPHHSRRLHLEWSPQAQARTTRSHRALKRASRPNWRPLWRARCQRLHWGARMPTTCRRAGSVRAARQHAAAIPPRGAAARPRAIRCHRACGFPWCARSPHRKPSARTARSRGSRRRRAVNRRLDRRSRRTW